MKNNLVTVTLVTTVLVFGIYVYNFPPNENKPVTPTISKNEICMDYSDDQMNTMNFTLVQNMIENYKNNQLKVINSSFESINDAQSVSFDLETLKKFLYHLEKNTKKNNETITNEQLGVRMHYAAYPDDETMRSNNDLINVNPEFKKHHTIIMIPTIKVNGIMVDFNPLDVNTYKNGLPINQSSINTTIQKKLSTIYGITGAQNHGTLIPPM